VNPLDKVKAISNSATDRRLSGTARALLSYLIDCANKGDEVWWGKDRLAGVLDRDRRTVARAFKRLIETGYIIKANPKQTGRGAFAVYRVFSAEKGGKIASLNSLEREAKTPPLTSEREAKLSDKGGQNCPPNQGREYINYPPSSPPQRDYAEPGLASARQVAPQTPPDARGAATASAGNANDAVTKVARQEGEVDPAGGYDQTAALVSRIKAFKISEENAASWLRGMIKAGATAQEISELLDHAKALGYDRDGLHVAGKSLLEKKRWDAMPAMQPSRRETPAHAAIAAAASSVTLKPGMDNFNLLKRLGAAIKGEVT